MCSVMLRIPFGPNTFSGSFSRDDSLDSILKMFSFSGELNYRIAQDSVFITDKIKK